MKLGRDHPYWQAANVGGMGRALAVAVAVSSSLRLLFVLRVGHLACGQFHEKMS